LEKVTKQAYAMVSYFGMSSKIGNISFYDSSGRYEYNFIKPYSEKIAEQIDQEAKKIIDEQYARAIKILKENAEGLKTIAEKLLEKEVLFSEDLEKVFGKRKDNNESIIENILSEKETTEDTTNNENEEENK